MARNPLQWKGAESKADSRSRFHAICKYASINPIIKSYKVDNLRFWQRNFKLESLFTRFRFWTRYLYGGLPIEIAWTSNQAFSKNGPFIITHRY